MFKLCGEQKRGQARLSPTDSQQQRQIADIYRGVEKIPVWADKFGKFTLDLFQSKNRESLWVEIVEGVFECYDPSTMQNNFVFDHTGGINGTVVPRWHSQSVSQCLLSATAPAHPKEGQPFLFQGNLHESVSDSMF